MSKQKIMFFSLARQVKNLEDKIRSVLDQVVQSQQFIGGYFVNEFEERFAKYLGAKYVISCNSGTDALWLALKVMNIEQHSIVLTTSFSFIASASEIVAHGADPVFVDVDAQSFNIDVKKIRTWLQTNAFMKNGKAVHRVTGQVIAGMVVVDLFGQCAEYDKIKQIAKEWNLWIVEDAAQGVGAEYKGKKAGTIGDVGCFSFYPTKNIGAFGDGGCCVTDNAELAEKILQLRNHGRKSHYNYQGLGVNSRLDTIQAAILSMKLEYLDEWNKRRQEIAAIYDKELIDVSFIRLPKSAAGHVYHQYSVQVIDKSGAVTRNLLEKYLAEMGIQTRVFYPKALNQFPFLNTKSEIYEHCPIAENLAGTILSLPIWPELENHEVEFIIDTIKSASTGLLKTLNMDERQEHAEER